METITLNNGVQMPMLGFGTWTVRGKKGEHILREALDVGYRLFDTAFLYGNHEIVGKAIRDSGIPRNNIFITTKLDRQFASYTKAKAGIAQAQETLQSDIIDLMLIHEPYTESLEMYQALEEAYREGTLRAIGISNFNANLYQKLLNHCAITPAVNQVENHVYYMQTDLQKVMEPYGTVMQAWGPLTEGKRPIFTDPILQDIAKAHDRPVAQIALRYLVQNGIPVIPKSSHRTRMQQNIDIFSFSLSPDEMATISLRDEGQSLFNWFGPDWI